MANQQSNSQLNIMDSPDVDKMNVLTFWAVFIWQSPKTNLSKSLTRAARADQEGLNSNSWRAVRLAADGDCLPIRNSTHQQFQARSRAF